MISEIIIKFIIGGSLVVGLSYFANNSSPFIASVLYASPTLFLSSAYFITEQKSLIEFAHQGSLMLLASIVYALSYGFLLKKYSKPTSTLLSFIPWALIVLAVRRFFHTT